MSKTFPQFSRNDFYDNTYLRRLRKDIQRVETEINKRKKITSNKDSSKTDGGTGTRASKQAPGRKLGGDNEKVSLSKSSDPKPDPDSKNGVPQVTLLPSILNGNDGPLNKEGYFSRERSSSLLKKSLQKKELSRSPNPELPTIGIIKKPVIPSRHIQAQRGSPQLHRKQASMNDRSETLLRLNARSNASTYADMSNDRLISPSLSAYSSRSISESFATGSAGSGDDTSSFILQGSRITPVPSPRGSPRLGRKMPGSSFPGKASPSSYVVNKYIQSASSSARESGTEEDDVNVYAASVFKRTFKGTKVSNPRLAAASPGVSAVDRSTVYTPVSIPAVLSRRRDGNSRMSVLSTGSSRIPSPRELSPHPPSPNSSISRQGTHIRDMTNRLRRDQIDRYSERLSNDAASIRKGKRSIPTTRNDMHAMLKNGGANRRHSILPKLMKADISKWSAAGPSGTSGIGTVNKLSTFPRNKLTSSAKAKVDSGLTKRAKSPVVTVSPAKTVPKKVPSTKKDIPESFFENTANFSRESTIHIDIAIENDTTSEADENPFSTPAATMPHDSLLLSVPFHQRPQSTRGIDHKISGGSQSRAMEIPEIRMICATPLPDTSPNSPVSPVC